MDDIKFVDLQNALLKAKQDGVDFDIDLLEVDNGIDEELQPVLDIEYHDQSVILSAKGSRKRLNSSSAREMSFYLPDHCELFPYLTDALCREKKRQRKLTTLKSHGWPVPENAGSDRINRLILLLQSIPEMPSNMMDR